MKKIFTLIVAALFSTMAMASTTTVGNEDNTTAWWTAFSDYYAIAPNKTLTLKFQNFSSKANNWNNWISVVTTDADRGGEGYAEYFVLRADNYGWGDVYNSGVLTSNYNWETFKDDMDGATVIMTLERKDAAVTVHYAITTAAGTEYYENFVVNYGDGTQTIRTFLTTELGHLVIDNDATTITDTQTEEKPTIDIEGTLIGNTDLSTAWWTAFSDYFTLQKNQVLTLEFTNYTNKIGNWHNWLLVATTDADRGDEAAGYKEYFVLRADNYCWGVYGNSNDNADIYQISSNYNWDTFKDDMYGAKVKLTLTRDGAKLTAHADITTAVGTEYYENLEVANCDDGEQTIRAFLTVEGGCLDLTKSEITDNTSETGIQSVKTVSNSKAVRYNLTGQQVADGFKGLVIENGRTFMMK
jgi:hypothetical protein